MSETFPERKVLVYSDDKPWYTEQLRHLKRQQLREYSANGKSIKYLNLLETYKLKQKEAIHKYRDKIKAEVLEGKRGSSYPALKRLGSRPYDEKSSQFHITSHTARNLTPEQSAEAIATHFSKISQES